MQYASEYRHVHNLKTFAKIWICCAILQAQPKQATIPFVGCESDGQQGPVPAPPSGSKVLAIDEKAAAGLAYYGTDEEFGVLAPRGWYCFGTYGSGGHSVYVSPKPFGHPLEGSNNWLDFSGDLVHLSFVYGSTSSRGIVADTIARVFPAYRQFVMEVMKDPDYRHFQFGPYPSDRLTYKSKSIVEYVTPPQTEGLGTSSSLVKNDREIRGVAMLVGQTPDLIRLAVRLPAAMSIIHASAVVQQAERDFTRHHER